MDEFEAIGFWPPSWQSIMEAAASQMLNTACLRPTINNLQGWPLQNIKAVSTPLQFRLHVLQQCVACSKPRRICDKIHKH